MFYLFVLIYVDVDQVSSSTCATLCFFLLLAPLNQQTNKPTNKEEDASNMRMSSCMGLGEQSSFHICNPLTSARLCPPVPTHHCLHLVVPICPYHLPEPGHNAVPMPHCLCMNMGE